MIDDKTPNLKLALPHPGNLLSEDVTRLRDALVSADAAIKALQDAVDLANQGLMSINSAVSGKAAASHGHSDASSSASGFMSPTEKTKLAGIAAGATNFTYTHPATHKPAEIAQDANNRFVTDTEKSAWNTKMDPGSFGLGAVTLPQTGDFNALPGTRFFMGTAATGAPTAGGWWLVQQICHNQVWRTQIAFGFAGNDKQVRMRQSFDKGGGVLAWLPWGPNMNRVATGVISVSTNAEKSGSYVLAAPCTLTLPGAPEPGDWVGFSNRSGSTRCVIARNTQNIMGLAEDLLLNDTRAFGQLVFADSTLGWVLM